MSSSHSHNDKPKGEPDPPIQKEGEVLIGLDKRLSDLMELGWTLVAESCPLERCHCPLLKSLDGNKYCVSCEMWQFPDKQRKKEKFTDLVIKQTQEIETFHETALTKINKNKINFQYTIKQNILNSLRIKLAYLSSVLNDNLDLVKTQQILNNIELCVKNIKLINESM